MRRKWGGGGGRAGQLNLFVKTIHSSKGINKCDGFWKDYASLSCISCKSYNQRVERGVFEGVGGGRTLGRTDVGV